MGRKRYAPEEIIGKLREAEVMLAQGRKAGEVSRALGVTEQTYYRWRREYGGMKVDQARRSTLRPRFPAHLRSPSWATMSQKSSLSNSTQFVPQLMTGYSIDSLPAPA